MSKTILTVTVISMLTMYGVVFANSAPVVSNVSASQQGNDSKLVDIYYDLADADGNSCTISLEVSDNSGLTWEVAAVSFTGDVGPGVAPGIGKHIVWDCGVDLPRIYGRAYKLRVTADDGQSSGRASSDAFIIDNRDNAWCEGADINLDGQVNFKDFAIVARYWLKNRVPSDMVLIPGGEFLMGDHHDGMGPCLPVHAVYVNSFYMSRYEISNQQYCDYLNSAYSQGLLQVSGGVVYPVGGGHAYCDTTISAPYSLITWNGSSFDVVSAKEEHPMVEVSWYGAAAYCNGRSEQEGYQQCYNLSTWECDFSKNGYRLPTEAEWEYAGRGGEHNPYYRYPWGDSIDGSKANYWNSGDPYETGVYPWTTPVDFYPANGYGLHDMAGNVWDWCNDWYSDTYYSCSPYDNPTGPVSGSERVLRGGCWFFGTDICRAAGRFNIGGGARSSSGGFRVVLYLD